MVCVCVFTLLGAAGRLDGGCVSLSSSLSPTSLPPAGQIYGMSRPVARYIAQNEAILHRFANEDVSVGAWLMGLDIVYDNNRRLCCDTEWKCTQQVGAWAVVVADEGRFRAPCRGWCVAENMGGRRAGRQAGNRASEPRGSESSAA